MDSIPVGLCQCGCGQPTAISTQSYNKGKPNRYIRGHNGRGKLGPQPQRWRVPDKTCAWCSRVFRGHNAKYCCLKCARTAKRTDNWDGRSGGGLTAWRKEVRRRDQVCQDCGATNGLHAHHIEEWSKNEALRYDVANGILLCIPCHRKRHPKVGFIGAGKGTGEVRRCLVCDCILAKGTKGDHCRSHQPYRPRPWRVKGHRDNYRKGLTCSVCSVPIHNGSKGGRCKKHTERPWLNP